MDIPSDSANCNPESPREQEKSGLYKTEIEIEIELNEIVANGRGGERVESSWAKSASVVEMTAPQIAAILTHTTEREIYRLIESWLHPFYRRGKSSDLHEIFNGNRRRN